MSALSPAVICNLAIGHLGSKESVESITTPKKAEEIVCAQWWDITRRKTLKLIKPNFALKRAILAASSGIVFGSENCFNIPADCLAVLGVGNIEDKENILTVENGKIFIDGDYDDGLQLRYVKDETDATKFTPEFVELLSWALAKNICFALTQSKDLLAYITQMMPQELSSASAMNAQENRPIRISRSKFKASRYARYPSFQVKK